MIRLLKPLEYYQEKYGTWMFGLNKLYLMMEKQHNRGQGKCRYIMREARRTARIRIYVPRTSRRQRCHNRNFSDVYRKSMPAYHPNCLHDADFAKEHLPFAGELYMGHLRYSTTGKKGLSYVHPFLRRNNRQAKNICICGNFNMTNIDEIFRRCSHEACFENLQRRIYTPRADGTPS